MNLTPDKISSHVIITDIDPKILARYAPQVGITDNFIMNLLSKHFSKGKIKDLRIRNGRFVQILFDERGYEEFYALAKKYELSAKNLVNHLCSLDDV